MFYTSQAFLLCPTSTANEQLSLVSVPETLLPRNAFRSLPLRVSPVKHSEQHLLLDVLLEHVTDSSATCYTAPTLSIIASGFAASLPLLDSKLPQAKDLVKDLYISD